MSQPNQIPNNYRRIRVHWPLCIAIRLQARTQKQCLRQIRKKATTTTTVQRYMKQTNKKNKLNNIDNNNNSKTMQKLPLEKWSLCASAYCTDHGSSVESSSSSSSLLKAETKLLLLLFFNTFDENHPRLPSALNYFSKFCGNSVEIHVPTISLITAYRCAYTTHTHTHIHSNSHTVYTYWFVPFYHHSTRFIIAFIQIHVRPEKKRCLCIVQYSYIHICAHKYLATRVQCELIGWNECISLVHMWDHTEMCRQ